MVFLILEQFHSLSSEYISTQPDLKNKLLMVGEKEEDMKLWLHELGGEQSGVGAYIGLHQLHFFIML